MVMNGYAGTLLRVDLTRGEVRTEATPHSVVRRFLGGRGLGAYLLYTEVKKGADPLGPENKLYASTGPLSGTLFPGACKMDFAAKSPLTGGYGSSSMGGKLAAELKYAGHDAIVLEGASERPVYLLVDGDSVELSDATDLWGAGSLTVERELKGRLGEDFQIASIGPAGENLVLYACINHDIGRQAGRCGLGAVMGAKGLKAIAVRGSRGIPIAAPDEFVGIATEAFQACKKADKYEHWVRNGTMQTTEWVNSVGALPTRNFQSGAFDQAPSIYADVGRSLVVADKGCFACPSPCGKYSHVPNYDLWIEGPEYETVGMLGANVALGDMQDIAKANWLCDELGLDTISAGGCIAWAMECNEKGLFSPSQLDGLDLRWGNREAIFALIERIARREGWLGDLLAQGTKRAADVVGHGSDKWAIQVKGLEQSAYDTHNATAMLLSYMTSDIGGHHSRAWAIWHDMSIGRDQTTPEKVAKVIELQHIRPLLDCLGCCRFLWVELDLELGYYASALQALTGVQRSWDELLHISERVWNLTRLYWAREFPEFDRAYDAPPARFVSEPATGGPTEGQYTPAEAMQKMLDDYYKQRGWDASGLPTDQALERLGLSGLVAGV